MFMQSALGSCCCRGRRSARAQMLTLRSLARAASDHEHPRRIPRNAVLPAAPVMLWSLRPAGGSAEVTRATWRRRLPEKIAADPAGRLVFFGFTDIGALNNVVELWRYPSAQASIRCEALTGQYAPNYLLSACYSPYRPGGRLVADRNPAMPHRAVAGIDPTK